MDRPVKYSELVESLSQLHDRVRDLTASVCAADYRKQYHSDLSPLGWHYGHIIYTEDLWLRDVLLNENTLKESDHRLYNPQNTPKPLRGKALMPQDVLLKQGKRQSDDNIALLNNPPKTLMNHRLMKDAYLLKFLLQHHALHLETMKMIVTQKHIQDTIANNGTADFSGCGLRDAIQVNKKPLLFEEQQYRVGGKDNWSFDNELPCHSIKINTFAINRIPVSNAEYLGFIEAGGYRNERYWNAEGLAWLKKVKVVAPDGWHYEEGWFQATPDGYRSLDPKVSVCGICYYEAQAFARYANARLAHEYEREVSHPKLEKNTDTWEWCENSFHPYPKFKPFPYPEYSTPWFNDHYQALRGGCRFNEANLYLRASFRNFYEKHKRHIFAGVRLAYDNDEN